MKYVLIIFIMVFLFIFGYRKLIGKPDETIMDITSDRPKIKTTLAQIIVNGSPKKPLYSILYLDPSDGYYHIGYSSYNLDYVFQWLSEDFEVLEPISIDEYIQEMMK